MKATSSVAVTRMSSLTSSARVSPAAYPGCLSRTPASAVSKGISFFFFSSPPFPFFSFCLPFAFIFQHCMIGGVAGGGMDEGCICIYFGASTIFFLSSSSFFPLHS